METESQKPATNQESRGRSADSPLEIPQPGWRDILARAKESFARDHVSIIAAGTAFFLLLGLVPGLAGLISVYGLFANTADIQAQFDAFSRVMPTEVRTVLEGELTRISSQHGTAGLAALLSVVLALWAGAKAIKSIMEALNIIYHEREERSFLRLTLTALGLTLAFTIVGALSILTIVALPPLLGHLGLAHTIGGTVVSLLRWPLLFAVALVSLATLYRYAPCRAKPKWRWVSPGALTATVLWLVGSGLFALYAQKFGSYNKTYGSLGAVVVLMMWLYISALAGLLGAEINAQAERQTARNTADPHSL